MSAGDLTGFLKARLDEDEALAKTAADEDTNGRWWRRRGEIGHGYVESHGAMYSGEALADADGEVYAGEHIVIYDEGRPDDDQFEHIMSHDPARVLREVEAKRAILELHKPDTTGLFGSEGTLRYLAAVYSDHPDYRAEWKP